MKLNIKIKRLNKNLQLPLSINKGEWVDLRCSETTKFKAPQSGTLKTKRVEGEEARYRDVTFDTKYLPLGVAMKLPKGFEAHVLPRSSTPLGMGIMCANSQGIIDNTYSGNTDEWKFPALAIRDTTIKEGERICQFRIQLSQKATLWQKIKWLLCSGISIKEVEELDEESRGGFGSTGKE
jgi:dUTP pyrophosphatase